MSEAGAPAEKAPTTYNPMFERFVPRDESDADYLPGLVAYALYKSKKQEWAMELRQRHGRPPTAADIDSYTATWTAGQITATRGQAEQALIEYAQQVVASARPDILREALRGGFLKSVGASVVAAIIYTAILIVLAVGLHANGIDLLSTYQGTTPPRPTPPAPAPRAPPPTTTNTSA